MVPPRADAHEWPSAPSQTCHFRTPRSVAASAARAIRSHALAHHSSRTKPILVDLLTAASVPGSKETPGGRTAVRGGRHVGMQESRTRLRDHRAPRQRGARVRGAAAPGARVGRSHRDRGGGRSTVVAAESRALLAPTGAAVTWTEAPRGAVVGPESLVVIAVPTYSTGSNRERHVMGSTRMVADGALAVWVFPDQVAWALGLDLKMRRSWGKPRR